MLRMKEFAKQVGVPERSTMLKMWLHWLHAVANQFLFDVCWAVRH